MMVMTATMMLPVTMMLPATMMLPVMMVIGDNIDGVVLTKPRSKSIFTLVLPRSTN